MIITVILKLNVIDSFQSRVCVLEKKIRLERGIWSLFVTCSATWT